ncbi:MAG: TetR/AcrR family transcriptional regulator [Bryobacteraceae bacterium]|nr:TetR/AcrR family transcriptional regulator [Bryobacteraceae bacterium]
MATLQRMPAPARRETILDTAIQLFSDRGFQGTTTRELAAAVGVTEPVLYQHFPAKSDLYSAIIERKIEQTGGLHNRLRELCEAQSSDSEFFLGIANLILEWHQDPTFIRLMLRSGLDGHELSRIFFERMSCDYLDTIAASIERRIAAGTLRQVEPSVAAYAFASMIGHYCLDKLLFPYKDLAGDDGVETMVDIFLGGLKKYA